ncbi:hypothetical protein [Actinophytocola oryzae]|uniref:LppX_LprAFG lipoprotein n=1 Tax=Actinophytocola oryzae TaxID=502181 RepID=A0A4R7VRP4_9PSEU|nr:hypothetical protein [Actinophytocola oryzae]TDV52486.1 hypothetical protein CLV71_105618 [Actinophytocola oryzae]
MRKAVLALGAFALAVAVGAWIGNGDSPERAAASAELFVLAKSIGDETTRAGSAHMAIIASGADTETKGSGDVRFAAEDAAMALDLTTEKGAIPTVQVGGTLFMRLPQEVAPGKPWLEIDPYGRSRLSRMFGPLNDQLSKAADPHTTLRAFHQAGEITAARDEDLDGRKVRHYTISVDVARVAQTQLTPASRQAIQAALAGGMTNFGAELWVDEQGLPARFTLDSPAQDGSGRVTSLKLRVDYTDWGTPVTITAPPEDQIVKGKAD